MQGWYDGIMRDFFRHFFLPHHTNNHRARLLHSDILAMYGMVFVLFFITLRVVSGYAPDVLGYATDIHVTQLLEKTNTKRAEAGLAPLTFNAQLSDAAAKKATDMFVKNYWAHVNPEGTTPWSFIQQSGYIYTVAGENLAKNFQNSASVVEAWMNSPSHRDNLLKPSYKDVGFAVVNGVLNGEETTLVVQMFGATKTSASIARAIPPVISKTAAQQVQGEQLSEPQITNSLSRMPAIDISSFTRAVSMLFIGFLLGILVIDIWVVRHRKLIRATGHPFAHILFFMILLVFLGTALRGSIL